MPRRARLAIAGIPWHIIQRGNNRSACFYAEDDYCVYLDTLLEQSVRWRCEIHAYVLMTNNVHLSPILRYLRRWTGSGDSLLNFRRLEPAAHKH